MTKYYPILYFLILDFAFFYAQTSQEVDSLISKASNFSYEQIDSSIYYNQLAIEKGFIVQNDTLLSRAYFNLAKKLYLKNKLTQSFNLYKKALLHSEKASFQKVIMLSQYQIGGIYLKKNNFIKALTFYNIAYKEAEKNPDLQKYLPFIKADIAYLYKNQDDTIQALKEYHLTKDLALQYNQKKVLSNIYNNLGNLHHKNNLDSALYYYKEGLQIIEELKKENGKGDFYLNIGNSYFTHKQYDSAYFYFQKALQHGLEYNDLDELYYAYYHLATYYKQRKEYSKSIQYFEKALAIEIDEGIDTEQKMIVYESMAELYANLKQYDKAYSFQQKHQVLKDSIFNIDKTNEFNKIRTEYEVENKNQQIELLTTEKEVEALRKRQLLYAGIGILIPLLLLILFYRNRVKSQRLLQEKEQQRHEAEKQRLEKENELEHVNALIEGQDQERNRIAKEIHDGVGAQLAGLKLNLEQTNQGLQNENLVHITQDLEQAFTELRSISHNLSTNYLEEKTLDVLLLDLKAQYEKNLTFTIGLYIFPPDLLGKLNQTDKHHLYRIVQELLNNTYKHAAATQVHISFTQHEDRLNLLYEDNGKGFNPSSKAKGIGLHNIQERVKALNGTLTLDSQPQKGTTIIIDSLKTT